MTPNTYALVAASARPEKFGVEITFADAKKKISRYYKFFPSFFLPHTSTTLFETLLLQGGMPKHHVLKNEKSIQVTAAHFEDLKKIAAKLFSQTGYYASLIEPERQFLLVQKWRYGQRFDEKLLPLNEAFGDMQLNGVAESLNTTLKGLQVAQPNLYAQWVEKLGASHELFIPFTDIPSSAEERMELFLENAFFSATLAAPYPEQKALDLSTQTYETRERLKKIIWNSPTDGEGNCSCCIPHSAVEKHVHSGSIVNAESRYDGLYIPLSHKGLSDAYDTAHPREHGKRVQRKKELGMGILPMGPLARNERVEIPLHDALLAQKEGWVRVRMDSKQMAWECKNQPYFLSQLRTQLEQRIQTHALAHAACLQPYLQQYQLAYTLHSRNDPLVQLHAASKTFLESLSSGLGWHVLTQTTRWRSARGKALLEGLMG